VKAIPPKREGDFENREGILSKEQNISLPLQVKEKENNKNII
jgi:hypothetical protein